MSPESTMPSELNDPSSIAEAAVALELATDLSPQDMQVLKTLQDRNQIQTSDVKSNTIHNLADCKEQTKLMNGLLDELDQQKDTPALRAIKLQLVEEVENSLGLRKGGEKSWILRQEWKGKDRELIENAFKEWDGYNVRDGWKILDNIKDSLSPDGKRERGLYMIGLQIGAGGMIMNEPKIIIDALMSGNSERLEDIGYTFDEVVQKLTPKAKELIEPFTKSEQYLANRQASEARCIDKNSLNDVMNELNIPSSYEGKINLLKQLAKGGIVLFEQPESAEIWYKTEKKYYEEQKEEYKKNRDKKYFEKGKREFEERYKGWDYYKDFEELERSFKEYEKRHQQHEKEYRAGVDKSGRMWYRANGYQNDLLRRQIIKNEHLFVDGKLPDENVSKWEK